jgi:trehalose-phosphatase
MSALRDRVRANDVHGWVQKFLASAEEASRKAQTASASPADEVERRLSRWLGQRPTVALFLDYDGTLTPIVSRPEEARLSDAARQVLEQAAKAPGLDTVIVSGRGLADIQNLVGIPGLTYVGNHGFEIEGPGLSYRHEAADSYRGPLEAAAEELAALAVPGAAVERKGATLAFHVRGVAAPDRRRAERRASAILRRRRLRVVAGKCVIEGRPPAAWHKGQAVLYALTRRHGADWPSKVRVLYIGDDQTDVDAFGSLHGIGRSIGVGDAGWGPALAADFRLPDPEAVLQLLRWLASGAYATGRP